MPVFGEILTKSGFITDEMLDFGLKVQSSGNKEKIGQILKSLGFITDIELAKVLAKQSGLEYLSMDKFKPTKEIIDKIPQQHAQKHKIFPLAVKENITRVGIADPFSDKATQCIKQYIPEPLEIVVAPSNLLLRAIQNKDQLNGNLTQKTIDQIQKEVRREEKLRTADLIQSLNYTAVELNASDMHISTTGSVCFISYRVDGVLQLRFTLPDSVHARIVSAYKLECNMDITETMRALDGYGKFEYQDNIYELRVSSMPTVHGENLVIRYLTTSHECMSLEELGFSKNQLKVLQSHLDSPSGVILCTGPTGSGKTTTLYGLVRRTNYLVRNVLTVEDPVEFKIPLMKQVSVNEKAGITFSNAIKSFLRQDPDIILIGEIRDEETAISAIRAAQTGHLMLSSLHTNNAIGSIARLRDLGVANYLLASTLSCVIAQRLVRKLCPTCKTKTKISPQAAKKLGIKSDVIYRHKGCEYCFDTGYRGRIAVAEILELSKEMKGLIEDGKSTMRLEKQVLEEGMVTIKQSIVNLIEAGITDDEEFYRVSHD